ncbi:MAG TPA: thioredoxin domain-containing protein [Kofleriaceae bacterium]|nr:thioredoxin domain-containing protein [Kofleriaceae bacterium]
MTALLAALTVGLLTGASCKKDSSGPVTDPAAVVAAADQAKKGSGAGSDPAPAALDRTPVAGVDVSRLPADRQDLFFQMLADLPSPCGKSHSLRTSVTSDASCKRAPFATKMVAEMIVDEASPDIIREFYEDRYVKHPETQTFDLSNTPMVGAPDAKVTFVEFFDYGCPACMQAKPVLDEVINANQARMKIYYKMYPLVQHHPDSYGCAQAALAAFAQGKFHEMHDIIFKNFGSQKPDQLRSYAEQIGLDMAKYDADLPGTKPHVDADMAEGQAKGVDSTPTIFINGQRYGGPLAPKYFAMAIDEALAVNN